MIELSNSRGPNDLMKTSVYAMFEFSSVGSAALLCEIEHLCDD